MQLKSIRQDIRQLVWVSLFALAAVCTVFVVKQVFETSMNTQVENKHALLQSVYGLETRFLMARRAEKDFLLRKDIKYVARHADIAQELMAQVERIEAQASVLINDDQINTTTAALTGAIDTYVQSFAALVGANTTLGLDEETGLQGTLRTAVKTAETSLNEFANPVLQVKMLMMRRHEKDFIMRGGQKYVDRLNTRVAEFQEFPTSDYPSAEVQTQLLALIADYQLAFNEYAQVYGQEAEARNAVSATFAEAEPHMRAW